MATHCFRSFGLMSNSPVSGQGRPLRVWMDPRSEKSRIALSAKDALQIALARARRQFRRFARKAVIVWLCMTSALANCVILADEPTFFGVPYPPRCEDRLGVCPS